MDIHERPQTPMDIIHGYPKYIYGNPWMPTDIHGYPWMSMDICGATQDIHLSMCVRVSRKKHEAFTTMGPTQLQILFENL